MLRLIIIETIALRLTPEQLGKKKLKAVSRAIRNAGKTPQSATFRVNPPFGPSTYQDRAPVYNYINQFEDRIRDVVSRDSDTQSETNIPPPAPGNDSSQSSKAIPGKGRTSHETLPLHQDPKTPGRNQRGMTRYGSIIGSPPGHDQELSRTRSGQAPSLRLPGPALTASNSIRESHKSSGLGISTGNRAEAQTDTDTNGSPTIQRQSYHHVTLNPRHLSIFQPKRVNSTPGPDGNRQNRPFVNRMLSMRQGSNKYDSPAEQIAMDAYRELDVRQAEFFMFLDSQLEKIEGFYKQKEDDATKRLKVLREQLHIMRDRRMEDVVHAQMSRQHKYLSQNSERPDSRPGEDESLLPGDKQNLPWLRKPVDRALRRANFGKTFQAMKELGTPSGPSALDLNRDYTRHPNVSRPPYRQAKHKLKLAMAEFYRGLELLKSYALLNRTAFRKINKKFEKTVNARPSGRYMAEKVNPAYFVNSEVLDGHIQAVEDLYARYFERGNHKVAVSKLRAKMNRAGDYTSNVFRNGILLATGTVFGVEGVVYAAEKLFSPDPVLAITTSYLLQVRPCCGSH